MGREREHTRVDDANHDISTIVARTLRIRALNVESIVNDNGLVAEQAHLADQAGQFDLSVVRGAGSGFKFGWVVEGVEFGAC